MRDIVDVVETADLTKPTETEPMFCGLPDKPKPAEAGPEAPPPLPQFVGTIGVFGVGKDYVLKKFGYRIVGFADPIYAISRAYLSTDDKSVPGVREFLQQVGQWARGTVSVDYPRSLERTAFARAFVNGDSAFNKDLRRDLVEKYALRFDLWGKPNFWTESMRSRLLAFKVRKLRVAVSNVRFLNELELMNEFDAQIWYVATTKEELKLRRSAAGKKTTSDTSEKLALGISGALKDDSEFEVEGVTTRPSKLIHRVVWNSTFPVASHVSPDLTLQPIPA